MKRKFIGIGAAAVLALVGTLLLVGYVQAAKDRATSSDELVDVFVVTGNIKRAASLDDVRDNVERDSIPRRFLAPDAVTDLNQLDDLYTTSELLPGEQLLRSRFATAGTAARGEVPAGLVQVSVMLDPERVVGGKVRVGDTVGVVLSYEPPVLPYQTHLELNKALVTDIQLQVAGGGALNDDRYRQEGVEEAVPQGSKYIVTVAVSAPEAEQVVHGAVHGEVWLINQPVDSSEDGTRVVNPANVYTGQVQ